MSPFPVFLGLDVGKKRDAAAWVGVVPKRLGWAAVPVWSVVVCEQAPLGTPYAQLASRTRELSAAFAGGGWPVLAAVDSTGIGAAVVEDLRTRACKAEVLALTAHGGEKLTGAWPDLGVPKASLVKALDAAIRRKGVAVTPGLPAAGTLKEQLKAYVAKTSGGGESGVGRTRFEAARERDHDDTVSAAQLAVFAAAYWWDICAKLTPGKD